MLMAIAVIATVLNIVLLLTKFKHKRYIDAMLDSTLLLGVMILFKGSEMMLLVGIFSSLVISIYLWFFAPSIKIKEGIKS